MKLFYWQSGASWYLIKFYLSVILIILALVGILAVFELLRKKYFSTRFYEQEGNIFSPPPPTYNPFKPLFPRIKRIYPKMRFEQFFASDRRWVAVIDIFEHFEKLLVDSESERYILILSSPEMGKTSFADLVMLWQKSKGLKARKVAYIPLSVSVARKKMHKLPNPRKTILILDDFEVLLHQQSFPDRVLKNWLQKTRKFELVLLLSRMENFPKIVPVENEPGLSKLEKSSFNGFCFRVYRLHPVINEMKSSNQIQQAFSEASQIILPTEIAGWPIAKQYAVYLEKNKADNILELLRCLCENAANAVVRKVRTNMLPTDVIAFWQAAAVVCYKNRIQQKEPSISNEQLINLIKIHLPKIKQLPNLDPPIMAQNQLGNWQFKQKIFEEYLVFRQFTETPEMFRGVFFTKPIQCFLWRFFKDEVGAGRRLSQKWLDNADLSHFLLKLPSKAYSIPVFKNFTAEEDLLRACLEKYPFFEAKYQSTGKGIEHLWQVEKLEHGNLISDYATGLMWEVLVYPYQPVNYSQAIHWVQNFNKHGFGGYRDWRLPVLEEALSLIYPIKINDTHLPTELSDIRKIIWTANPYNEKIWIVDYQTGRALLATKSTLQYVRLVRNFR
jgi:hypothetical protein